jgi:hypothetical protein
LLTRENTIISVVQKQVCGQQYESGSKPRCLASYHAFVSRLARINRSRLNSCVFDVDMSLSRSCTTGIKSVSFGPSPLPTTAPLSPYGASSGTEAAVTDVPPGVLVLIIPTILHFVRVEAYQPIPWKAGLKPILSSIWMVFRYRMIEVSTKILEFFNDLQLRLLQRSQ